MCVCASAPSEAMQSSVQSGRVLDRCSLFVFPAEKEEKLQEEISGREKEQNGKKRGSYPVTNTVNHQ